MEKLKKVSPFRLSSLLRLEKDPNSALKLFRNPNPNIVSDKSLKPFRHSLLSYDLIISKLGRAKMFDQMERVLDQMKQETRFSPKEIVFCNVIRFYGRARMSEQALRMFDHIPSFRCKRTVRSLNTLLNALLNCREHPKIREIYLDIDRYASPDVCTYNVLINAACKNDCLDDAWNMFDEMRNRGIGPNDVTFSTLVSALCVKSRLDEAFRLKEDMVKMFHVKPNVFLYTSLIKGLCKVNELDSALKLKEEMLLDKKLGLNTAVYSTLISALFKWGQNSEAMELLEEMNRTGCKPDTVTYNAMISGFCDGKDFDSAFGILNEKTENGSKPDVISYNVIIAGLCKDGKLREAIDLFEDMPRRKCVPDIVTYRTLFDGLCDSMEIKEFSFLLDEMIFKGFVPRIESVNKFVNRLCREEKTEFLGSVLSSLMKGNIIDEDTWRMVITTVCRGSKLSNSFELVNSVQECGPLATKFL